jgi:TolB-like protein
MPQMAVFPFSSTFISSLSRFNGMQEIERRAQENYNKENPKVKSHAANLLLLFVLIYHNKAAGNVKVWLQMTIWI